MASTLRLSAPAQTALERMLARRPGISANELINQLLIEVDEGYGHAERVRTAFADGEERWSEVLERLRRA